MLQELDEVRAEYTKTQASLEKIETQIRQALADLQEELEGWDVLETDHGDDLQKLLDNLTKGLDLRKKALETDIENLEEKQKKHDLAAEQVGVGLHLAT